MAKLWLECDSVLVIFLIFSCFPLVLSSQDYYFTESDSSNHDIEIYTLQRISKRSAINLNLLSADEKNGTQVSINHSTTSDVSIKTNVSEGTEIIDNKKPLPPPEIHRVRNLGENGTGIRKNFTSTTTPQPITLSTTPTTTKAAVIIEHDHDQDFRNNSEEISISTSYADDSLSFNKTFLKKHNITESKTDNHVYYNSTFWVDEKIGRQYWVDMTNRSDVKVNELLSQSYRRAATIRLSFDFPFYGHPVRNITIATGGFLYTGTYVHSWLAATQYIAPLMANFDTTLSNSSYIKYIDNGTAFTVQWEKVSLQDNPAKGEFTFQVTLLKNGNIIFVYKDVPLFIENINDNQHPVKVGLSDAYIIDRTIFLVRRKTIYEYHKVNFNKDEIRNWTVIYLTALPTCLGFKDCNLCVTSTLPSFKCMWCPILKRCSSGMDRYRQDWVTKGCDKGQVTSESGCQMDSSSEIYEEMPNHQQVHASSRWSDDSGNIAPDGTVKMGISGIMTIIFLFVFVGGLGIWIFYAYRNPHSMSGQILIRYRPSQWRWKRGETRYTAATIHM